MDNEQRTFGAVGPLVRVEWNDAAQQVKMDTINGKYPSFHLAKCESIGELIIDDPKALILVQHWSDTDGVDVLAIPRDWCQKIVVLEEVGTVLDTWKELKEEIKDNDIEICTLENLESQPE